MKKLILIILLIIIIMGCASGTSPSNETEIEYPGSSGDFKLCEYWINPKGEMVYLWIDFNLKEVEIWLNNEAVEFYTFFSCIEGTTDTDYLRQYCFLKKNGQFGTLYLYRMKDGSIVVK